MKNVFLLLNVMFLSALSFGTPLLNNSRIREVIKSGDWSDPSIWDNQKLPGTGDYIMIPADFSISISQPVIFDDNSNVYNVIYIHGKLIFSGNGKLSLPKGSSVNVETSGQILNESPNTFDRIRIGNSIYFTGNDEAIKGPYQIKCKASSSASYLSFNVALQHKHVLIQWTTSNEIIKSKFELQRNIGVDNWVTIANVEADPPGQNLNTYKFIDKDKNSIIADYRLKIIDNSGAYAFSPIRSVRYAEPGPNVSIGTCTAKNIVLHFSQELNSSLVFKLENLSGDVVESKKIKVPVGDIEIKLKNVPPGSYMATVSGPLGFRYMQPVKF